MSGKSHMKIYQTHQTEKVYKVLFGPHNETTLYSIMIETNTISHLNHSVCPSRDEEIESSWLSQGLTLSSVPTVNSPVYTETWTFTLPLGPPQSHTLCISLNATLMLDWNLWLWNLSQGQHLQPFSNRVQQTSSSVRPYWTWAPWQAFQSFIATL